MRAGFGAALIGLVLLVGAYIIPRPELPLDKVKELAQNHFNDNSSDPLIGKVAIVTGATSGLGFSLALQLYKLGATVVLSSRSIEKSKAAAANITQSVPESRGRIIAQKLDVSDFDDVARFSSWYMSMFSTLHMLINNAGINYDTTSAVGVSNQGFDLCFASNYLGHFLLTELMLPLLELTPNSRVIQVSSSSHYIVNGDDLRVNDHGLPPAAVPAQDQTGTGGFQSRAYGNSKLAQLLHTVELQRRINSSSNGKPSVKVIAVSPGLTSTGMVPSSLPISRLFGKLFYSSEAATLSILYALWSPNLYGGEFVTNAPNPWFQTSLGESLLNVVTSRYLKKVIAMVFVVPTMLACQFIFYGSPAVVRPSSIVLDAEIANALYSWSMETTKPYLP
mmetsp:Transcript_11007/g.16780  ORF Transcript_11007/g.16780 Transcript_11007/m.16780 type:complete len:392 (+) Transcript_11007:23-1198(+)